MMSACSSPAAKTNWKTLVLKMICWRPSFREYDGGPTAWVVVEVALLLSHGQATVDRGFSINKELAVMNQQEYSLVARTYFACKGVNNIAITRAVVLAAHSARCKLTATSL